MLRTKKDRLNVRRDHVMRDNLEPAVSPPNGGSGLAADDTHTPIAAPVTQIRGDQESRDTQKFAVSSSSGEGDHAGIDTQLAHVPLPQLVQTITELWRRRQAWHRAEKSLTLQIKAFCRRLCGGDKGEAEVLYQAVEKHTPHALAEVAILSTLPLFTGRKPIERERKQAEKQLRHLGTQLPGARFCTETIGLTTLTLAALIGECPGLTSRGFLDFDTPSRVWKRLGLAVMPDGTRQRRITGAEAIAHGYSPARRSMVWTFGSSLIKSKGPYRTLYEKYKQQEEAKAAAKGLTILPAAQITEKRKTSGLYISKGHIDARATRRVEKAMVCDVWAAFRTEAGHATASTFTYRQAA